MKNNLDGLRLLFAWAVVLVHGYGLSGSTPVGAQQLSILHHIRTEAAVEGFFAISGCLIVASWDRSPDLRTYMKRRGQRILPGYLGALIYTLVLGAALTTYPLGRFFTAPMFWKYCAANLVFLNFLAPSLPGVFAHNAWTEMNGALWTLKLEVAFYLLVPFMVYACRRCGPGPILGALFTGSALFRVLMMPQHAQLALQLPGQLLFFVVGAAVYFYYDLLHRYRWMALGVSFAMVCAWLRWEFFLCHALGWPLFVLAVGFFVPVWVGVTRWGDFSYGTYVLHFPTIQALVAVGLFARPWRGLALASLLVVVLAVCSWFCVERPFLRRARVLRVETVG